MSPQKTIRHAPTVSPRSIAKLLPLAIPFALAAWSLRADDWPGYLGPGAFARSMASLLED